MKMSKKRAHLDPERLNSSLAALMDGETVTEVHHIVLGAMNHKHWRRYLPNLLNTEKKTL